MIVLTVDQRGSRRAADRVAGLLTQVNGPAYAEGRVRRFERTAGDEVQGLLGGAEHAVRLALDLVRDGHWSVGVGVGAVRMPVPSSVRAGSGAAFEHARSAVGRAKRSTERIAVAGPDPTSAAEADAVLVLLAALVDRRSPAAWEAADLVAAGASQTAAAERLGISKQALSQRLQAGLWAQEMAVRPVAARLLSLADLAPVGSVGPDRDPGEQ